MRWRSYVAVGDSFTEGLNDIMPDERLRGWADLVAARLATERATRPAGSADDGVRYANLAVRGRLFARIGNGQVPVALETAPELVSFAGGGNDGLRPSFEPARLLARFDELVRTFRATGA